MNRMSAATALQAAIIRRLPERFTGAAVSAG
jgi:hypothetical protein